MTAAKKSSPHRRFAMAFIKTALGIFILSFVANTTVDPLWVSPAPWTSDEFADYKPIHKQPRTGKAGLAMRGGWDAVIIGSSRVDIALDPRNPLWGESKVANLGLRGGNLCEFEPLLKLAVEHNDLDHVILGVDHYDLVSPRLIPNEASFAQSPLSDDGRGMESTIRNYLSGSTFGYSIKAINYRAEGRLASYDKLGQWSHSLDGRPFRAIFETDSLPQAHTWIERSVESNESVPEKREALMSIMDICRVNGIRLTILIPPNHAAYLALFFSGDAPDPTFSQNRNTLMELVTESDEKFPDAQPIEVWDFCDYHPLNCESIPPEGSKEKMSGWIDGTHATPLLGDLMLMRMLGNESEENAQNYGTLLNTATPGSRDAALRSGYKHYATEHPEDHEWASKLLSDSDDKGTD